MKNSIDRSLARHLFLLISFFLPVVVNAQSALQNYTFSYSIFEADAESIELLESTRSEILLRVVANGGTSYATWVSVEKPSDAPFAGLSENQMGLMIAWPNDVLQRVDVLDEILQPASSVTTISNRLFEAIYLPAGLRVPTMEGFYVHREEKYSLDDVDEAVRLSKEAWVTWEPHWGVTVIGLFREIETSADFDNLNRIVWYPSFDAWLATRSNDDIESANRFRQRRGMLIPGSGVAIATDRILP